MGMSFLEEEGIGGELHSSIAHAMAQPRFIGREWLSVIRSLKIRDLTLVGRDDYASTRREHVRIKVCGDTEPERHVVPLHE